MTCSFLTNVSLSRKRPTACRMLNRVNQSCLFRLVRRGSDAGGLHLNGFLCENSATRHQDKANWEKQSPHININFCLE